MTIRLHLSPIFDTPDTGDGGIRRVVEAQLRWLPEFGVAVVRDPAAADLCAVHGAMHIPRTDVPLVAHCHGLMWSEYAWGPHGDAINRAVIDTLVAADAVTAPSHWVARAISRGMLLRPEVIYHGVDTEAWAAEPSQGYVLWNKARADAVSDPAPVGRLAALLPDVPFVTTFGAAGGNVLVTGPMGIDAMRPYVQRAGVYLATARETFGIGTLEALAAGVPVVGWDYGGQREIVTPETGILVPEGDDAALADAIRWVLADRDRYSRAARADAIARWGWRERIRQYADLYHRVLAHARQPRPRVSVVITAYNLNRYLPEAIESALRQPEANEVIVVDDGGAEEADLICRRYDDLRLRCVRTENQGLSRARNEGASLAAGKYLIFLDGDDALAEGALGRLAAALDADRSLSIAAGGLALLRAGGGWDLNPWPTGRVDFRAQAAHLNQLHYAAMWRRDAFLRTGGYRARDWRAEDAGHWLRAMAGGLRAAQVTAEPTLLYRLRDDSKTRQEHAAHADKDGDWTAWFPYRLGASSGVEGAVAAASQAALPAARVPFGAPVSGGRVSWPVWHREAPLVSVVIPVGPAHADLVIDALDSLAAQTCGDWEAIVVNDTGAPLDLPGHPWAEVVATDGGAGAGAARNLGLAAARAPLVLWLDADDVLRPEALQRLLETYAAGEAAYVYCDTLVAGPGARIVDAAVQPYAHLPAYRDGAVVPLAVAPTPEYDRALFLKSGYRKNRPGCHSVTALVETAAARDVGGFDAALPGWEDWEFYLRLAATGYCGARCPAPLLVYRLTTGRRRQAATRQQAALMKQIGARYAPLAEGDVAKGSCCGGLYQAKVAAALLGPAVPDAPAHAVAGAAPAVRVRYTGDLAGEHSVVGRPSGRVYRVGNNPFNKFNDIDPRDAAYLVSLGTFEVVG